MNKNNSWSNLPWIKELRLKLLPQGGVKFENYREY